MSLRRAEAETAREEESTIEDVEFYKKFFDAVEREIKTSARGVNFY